MPSESIRSRPATDAYRSGWDQIDWSPNHAPQCDYCPKPATCETATPPQHHCDDCCSHEQEAAECHPVGSDGLVDVPSLKHALETVADSADRRRDG